MTVEYCSCFVAIRYHIWWPSSSDPYYLFNVSENTTRNNYYGNNYAPHFFIDGNIDGEANRGAWEAMIDNESANFSPLTMDMWGEYNADTDSGRIYVRIIVEDNPGLSTIRLRVALTESRINWHAPNGANWHEQTFRDMIPSTYGQAITLVVGDTIEHSFPFATRTPMVANNCHLVAFVQSDQNKHILQSAYIALPDLTPTAIGDENDVPGAFSLLQNYPNPFNASTTIEFETAGGLARLDVFDVTGAKVATLVDGELEAGLHSVTWHAGESSSGTYFYRLKDSSGSETRKMTLLK